MATDDAIDFVVAAGDIQEEKWEERKKRRWREMCIAGGYHSKQVGGTVVFLAFYPRSPVLKEKIQDGVIKLILITTSKHLLF